MLWGGGGTWYTEGVGYYGTGSGGYDVCVGVGNCGTGGCGGYGGRDKVVWKGGEYFSVLWRGDTVFEGVGWGVYAVF